VVAGAATELEELVLGAEAAGLAGFERLAGIPGWLGGAVRMNAGAFRQSILDHVVSITLCGLDGVTQILTKDALQPAYRASKLPPGLVLEAQFELVPSSVEELAAERQRVLAERHRGQPWRERSAGCIFRNPTGASAAWWIERCGLKGYSCGEAQISELHSNFIINRGRAQAREVLNLARLVQQRVRELGGPELELEICLLGEKWD